MTDTNMPTNGTKQKTQMSTCNFSHLIFDQDVKNLQWRKDSIFDISKNCMSTHRRMKSDLYLSL